MMNFLKWYWETWQRLMVQPILFYTRLPEGPWYEDSVNFGGASLLILSLLITIGIFFTQYIGLMQTLTAGLSPLKLVIVSPVIIIYLAVISIMTFLIASGIILTFFLSAFFVLGIILHFSLKTLGGNGKFFDTVKAVFYSLGIVQSGSLLVLLAIITRFVSKNFGLFVIGENLVYYGTALYAYGLWSIAGKEVHKVERWQAFLAAAIPFILMALFNFAFVKLGLPKFSKFIV